MSIKSLTIINDQIVEQVQFWRDFFPETSPRKLQEEVLDFVTKNWEKYDNFILELPPGVGKSAIAVCLGRTLTSRYQFSNLQDASFYEEFESTYAHNKTYITTTSIELQEQYMSSYQDKGLVKLYSADNFQCSRLRNKITCSAGQKICKSTRTQCPRSCPYIKTKKEFCNANYGIVNTAYYINETNYAGQLEGREVAIFDEAHTLGDVVKSFVSLEITAQILDRFNADAPEPDQSGSYSIVYIQRWLKTEYIPALDRYFNYVEGLLKDFDGEDDDPELLKLVNELDSVDKYLCRVRRISKYLDPKDWVIEEPDEDTLILTPISPKHFMKTSLLDHCQKSIFMSATILDANQMINEYDLDKNKTAVFTAPSPFSKENRKVYYAPCGKLKYDNLEKSLEKFVSYIEIILEEHKGERGIIFVSSYKQAHEIIKRVNSPRLLTHNDSSSKKAMMEEHMRRKDTVMISPSMHEGVDLKDDISRFQIVMKLPFLSLGSKAVKRRMELEPEWYAHRTVMTLIQSTGRSVRSENDKATTYILDSNFGWFYQKWQKFFPKWWKESLEFV